MRLEDDVTPSKASATFNINCQVAVVLTEAGASQWNGFYDIRGYIQDVSPGTRIEVPLWELMGIFGPVIWMGNKHLPFVNNEVEFIIRP